MHKKTYTPRGNTLKFGIPEKGDIMLWIIQIASCEDEAYQHVTNNFIKIKQVVFSEERVVPNINVTTFISKLL